MFSWLSENIWTIVITLFLALMVAGIIVLMIIRRKKGKSSCGCGCDTCGCKDCCARRLDSHENDFEIKT